MKLKTLLAVPFALTLPMLSYASELQTEQQKLSYIFGIQVGQGLVAEGVDIEIDAFSAGIADMLEGNEPKIDMETAQKLAAAYREEKQEEHAKQAQLKQQKGNAFLAENAKDKDVHVTDTGLQYKVIKEGSGKSPTAEDKVVAHYKGTLVDGTVFDSSYERDEPATFPVSGVIPGWQEALPLMKEGGKWQIVIPPKLGYGERGAGKLIGPNETLIFDIELISVSVAQAETAK